MKIFYRMSFIFVLSIIAISCSKDNETTNSEVNSEESLVLTNRAASNFNYYEATQAIINDVDNGYEYEFPLTQSDLDRLKDLTGITEEVDLEGVNTIIGEVSSAHAIGYDKYMNDKMDIQEFTKQTVLSIASSGSMPNVEDSREFKGLPWQEQTMIRTANDIVKNWEDNNKGKQQRGVIDEIFCAAAGGAVGSYIGSAIGGFFGGPVGATIGGWIGGAIGGFLGWVFGSSK